MKYELTIIALALILTGCSSLGVGIKLIRGEKKDQ